MKFGLYAPVPHVTINTKELQAAADNATMPLEALTADPAYLLSKDIVQIADQTGFDICLVAERHLGPDLEAWIHAGALSSFTERITIMPAFHPGLWNPALIAKMSVSLDRMTKGRTALNMVPGANEHEHVMFGGSTLEGTDGRYVRAEEFVECLKGLWAEETFQYEGQFFQYKNARLMLKPASVRPPEVFVATKNPRGMDMAAKVADWWFLNYDRFASSFADTLKSVKTCGADMDERSKKYGRKVKYAVNAFVVCDDSDEKAKRRAQKMIDEDMNKDWTHVQSSAMGAGLVGSPETIAERIALYEQAGVELILMKFYSSREDIERIGKEILPLAKEQIAAF